MLMASSLAIAWKENDLESFLAFFNASEIWLKSMKDAERMVVNSKSCNQLTEGLPLFSDVIAGACDSPAAAFDHCAIQSEATRMALAAQSKQIRDKQAEKEIIACCKQTIEHRKQRDKLRQEEENYAKERDRREKARLLDHEERKVDLEVELKAILAELSLRKTSSVAKVDGNVNSEKVKDVIREMDYWKRQESPKVMLDSFLSESFGGTSDYQHLHEQEMVKKATSLLLGSLDRRGDVLSKKAADSLGVGLAQIINKSSNVGAEKLGKTDLSEDLRVIASNDQKRPLRSSFGTRGKGKIVQTGPKADDTQKPDVCSKPKVEEIITHPADKSQKDARNRESKNQYNWGKGRQRRAARRQAYEENNQKDNVSAENKREAKNYKDQMTKIFSAKDASKLLNSGGGGADLHSKKPNRERRKKQK